MTPTPAPIPPSRIYITESLATGIYSVIKTAADRGAFKLEEYGAVASVIGEFNHALQNNRLPTPAVENTPETEEKE
jgi:hypothetical protein